MSTARPSAVKPAAATLPNLRSIDKRAIEKKRKKIESEAVRPPRIEKAEDVMICPRCRRRSVIWDRDMKELRCIWTGKGCEKITEKEARGGGMWRKRLRMQRGLE